MGNYVVEPNFMLVSSRTEVSFYDDEDKDWKNDKNFWNSELHISLSIWRVKVNGMNLNTS